VGPLAALSIVGLVALVAFRICEARVHSPMLPLCSFAQKTSRERIADGCLLYFALGGGCFLYRSYLIQVQDFRLRQQVPHFAVRADHVRLIALAAAAKQEHRPAAAIMVQ